MNKLSIDCKDQYDSAISLINVKKGLNISETPESKKLFTQIYFLNTILTRHELKNFFNQDFVPSIKNLWLNIFFNFVTDNYIAVLFELRGVLDEEMNLICSRYHITLSRKFSENKKMLSQYLSDNDLKSANFETKIAQFQSQYSEVSGIFHSFSTSRLSMHEYLNDLLSSPTPERVNKVLNNGISILIYFDIFISSDSLRIWEKNDIENMFSLVFGTEKTERVIQQLKDHTF